MSDNNFVNLLLLPQKNVCIDSFDQAQKLTFVLHPVISKACSNLIDRKCGLEAKAQDGTGVMECLVRHKMDHPAGSKGAMNNKVDEGF